MTFKTLAPEHRQKPVHRPVLPAILQGFLGNCPQCGTGKLFGRFVKTNDTCATCGNEFHHHRADDLPAYLVILIVGHIVVGAAMAVQMTTDLGMWWHLAIWIPIVILAAVFLLQPVKGAVIGLQWALYMHGFGGDTEEENQELHLK